MHHVALDGELPLLERVALLIHLGEAEGGVQVPLFFAPLLLEHVEVGQPMVHLQQPDRGFQPGDLPLFGLQFLAQALDFLLFGRQVPLERLPDVKRLVTEPGSDGQKSQDRDRNQGPDEVVEGFKEFHGATYGQDTLEAGTIPAGRGGWTVSPPASGFGPIIPHAGAQRHGGQPV